MAPEEALYFPMAYLDLAAGSVYYEQHGSGPDLLLLHNGFESGRTWEAVLPRLAAEYRVTLYDRIGFGRSQEAGVPEGDIVASGVVELLALLDGLNIEKPLLIGHCLGAAIALAVAAAHPERVAGVIAEACGFYGDRDTVRKCDLIFQPWAELPEGSREQLVQMHGPERAPLFWEASCRYKAGYVMNSGYDLRRRLAAVTCPVLVMAGEDDILFSPRHTRSGAEALPDARLRLLPGVGHDVHREARELWLRVVGEFLKSVL